MKFSRPISKLMLPLLVAVVVSSCDKDGFCLKGQGDTETRVLQLSAIDQIKVNGSARVNIRYGAQQHVEVNGQPNILDELNVNVNNGSWTIETNRCVRKHKTLEVNLTLPSIHNIELNGSGRVEMKDTFEESEFSCFVNGSGNISAAFESEKAVTRVNGSGNIYLEGFARQHTVSITGSGSAQTFGLASERATVNISGSGNAEVRADQTLDVNISGSGKVYYKGNPVINSNVTGSGKLIKS